MLQVNEWCMLCNGRSENNASCRINEKKLKSRRKLLSWRNGLTVVKATWKALRWSLFLVPPCGTHCYWWHPVELTVSGATLCNSLPLTVHDPSLTLTQLCTLLKTVLFCRAYKTLAYRLRDSFGFNDYCVNADVLNSRAYLRPPPPPVLRATNTQVMSYAKR